MAGPDDIDLAAMLQDPSTADIVARMPKRSAAASQVLPDWLVKQQEEAQSANAPLHGEAFPYGLAKTAGIAASMLPAALPAKVMPLIGGALGALSYSPEEAEAAPKKAATTLPGLPPETNAEYAKLLQRAQDGFDSSADRKATMDRIQQIRDLSNNFVTKQQESGQSEYNRKVAEANAAKKQELDRDYRFPDTTVGKVWRGLGPAGPAAVGAATAGLLRGGMGPGASTLGKVLSYLVPMGAGTAAGAASANGPLMADSLLAPAANPEKLAYEKAAFLLPEGHPDKEKFENYAKSLPDANPVRSAAADELYDKEKLAHRMGIGGIEGFVGSTVGIDPLKIGGRIFNYFRGGGQGGPGGAGTPPPGAGPGGGGPGGLPANLGHEGTADEPIPLLGETVPPPQAPSNRLVDRMAASREAAGKPPGLSSVLQEMPTPAPRPQGGTRIDHNWNAKAGRWQDVDGKFLPGTAPKE